jgi:hypothetical protein
MTIIETDTHIERPEPGEYLVAPEVKFTIGDYDGMAMFSVWNPDDHPIGTRLFTFTLTGEPENLD